MRAYDWLGVSLAALVDVNEGYKTAYGGQMRWGGIEVANDERKSPPPLKTDFAKFDISRMKFMGEGAGAKWGLRAVSPGGGVQVGESAQGVDISLPATRQAEDRGPYRRGPVTPNGFEDITPVTKGEWLCLMVGEGWKEPRMVPVVTC